MYSFLDFVFSYLFDFFVIALFVGILMWLYYFLKEKFGKKNK